MPSETEQPARPAFPAAKLLRWYRKHRRALPWRPRPADPKTGDPGVTVNPYHVFVSEAMAQQTQIATVLPYFARFVEKFPAVEALAESDEQDVLKLWQGLGYYSRARNLRKAARMIVDDFGGDVPRTVEDLRKLPGVGRYTAGAVASVAYNQPAPIVDGNVARVLARFDLMETPVNDTPTLKQLWGRAEQLVGVAPRKSRGDFNQALMELGALVCTPTSPKCLYCPLRDGCRAHDAGVQDTLPAKTPKKKPVEVTHFVLAIERRGKLLFEQRPAKGLWSNMWQMPTLELPASDSPPFGRGRGRGNDKELAQKQKKRTRRAVPLPQPLPEGGELRAWAQERFGLALGEPVMVDAFTHQTTHRTIIFRVFRAQATGGRLRPKAGRWENPQRLDDLPIAKPQTKALAFLD